MRQEILVGPERRRRWSDGEKIWIVLEAAEAGVSVAEVARRHDITRQQIYQWRSAMRQGRLVDEAGGPFLSIEYVDTSIDAVGPATAESVEFEAVVEITLGKGRVLRPPAMIPPALLTALIQATEAA